MLSGRLRFCELAGEEKECLTDIHGVSWIYLVATSSLTNRRLQVSPSRQFVPCSGRAREVAEMQHSEL